MVKPTQLILSPHTYKIFEDKESEESNYKILTIIIIIKLTFLYWRHYKCSWNDNNQMFSSWNIIEMVSFMSELK